ncbi:MAG: hypothetical protein KDA61_03560 [Planctomycetales bacterium]|nr:hypothetical protein [Planctomycetales bacterium]
MPRANAPACGAAEFPVANCRIVRGPPVLKQVKVELAGTLQPVAAGYQP